jgi:hypothetical protein
LGTAAKPDIDAGQCKVGKVIIHDKVELYLRVRFSKFAN